VIPHPPLLNNVSGRLDHAVAVEPPHHGAERAVVMRLHGGLPHCRER
jgi:hypothetical protein